MSWFYLALLAPLLYAIVNLLDDNLLSYVYKSPYVACVSAGFFGSLPLLSRFVIHSSNISTGLALLAVSAGICTVIQYFFYFKGLASDVPSVVVSLFSLAPATIPFLAYFFVHERLVPLEILGFVIVLLASLGISSTDLRHFKFSKALIYIFAAVALLDFVAITTKYDYEHAAFYPVYLYFSAGMGLGGLLFLGLKFKDNVIATKRIGKNIKKLLPLFVLAEVTGLSAELSINLATNGGPVSLVRVIEGSQPMYVLLIALLLYPFAPRFFREAEEGQSTRKFILMVMLIAGLAIVNLGART